MRASLTLVLWLKHGVWLVAGWALLWGAAVLIARATVGMSRVDLAWGAIGLPVVLIAGLVIAMRRLPGSAAIRSVLDRHSRAGGLLMAEGEVDVGAWRDRLPTASSPRVRWRGGAASMMMLCALAFAGAAFAVPDWWVVPAVSPPLDVSEPTGQLQQQIDVLAQERVLDDDQARSLRDELDRLKRTAMGADPVRTWEALDHLQDTVDQAAKAAAEQALRQVESMAGAESLAEAVKQAMQSRDPESLAEAMREAGEQLKQALQRDPLLNQLVPEAMKQLAEAGRLTPQDMGRLAQQLRDAGLDRPGLADALKRAEALARLGQQMDAQLLDELGRELAQLLEQMLREHPELAQQMAGGMGQGQPLTPEQLDALLKALKEGRLDLRRMLEALADANMADPEALKLADRLGEIDPQALIDFLNSQCEGGKCNAASLASMLCEMPGSGGISRGPGAAPMIHGPESTPDGVSFKEKVLPPGQVAALKDSQMLGVTQDAPELDADAQASAGGALDTATAGGGSAVRHPVLPRHQGAVRRYFDREQQ
jgi:hypothetical protein